MLDFSAGELWTRRFSRKFLHDAPFGGAQAVPNVHVEDSISTSQGAEIGFAPCVEWFPVQWPDLDSHQRFDSLC